MEAGKFQQECFAQARSDGASCVFREIKVGCKEWALIRYLRVAIYVHEERSYMEHIMGVRSWEQYVIEGMRGTQKM